MVRINRPSAVAMLALAAGLPTAASAAIFNFSGTCSALWYQECQTSPCGAGGWNTFNNWGQSGCAFGLAAPGASDDANIGAATVTINSNVSVNSISSAPSGVLIWSAGNLTVAQPLVNVGTVVVPGNHKMFTGMLFNESTLLVNGDWNFQLSNGQVVNNATMDLQGSKQLYENGGVNAFTNNGTVFKTSGGTVDWRWPTVNNELFDTQNGSQVFQFTTVQSNAGSAWTTGADGVVRFNGCAISGLFDGVNSGTFQIDSNGVTIPDHTTFAVTGNGVNWSSGNITMTAGKTLTNTGLLSVPGNHKLFSGVLHNTGTVVASGDWNWQLSNGTFTNAGQFTLSGSKQCYENGGTNLFTNSATVLKSDSGVVDWRWPTVNNALFNTQSGTLFFANTSVQSSNASTWTVGAGGTVRLTGCSMSGRFAGVNAGTFQIESNGVTVPASTTFAFTGNGLNWASGNIAVASGQLLTNTGIFNVPGGHKLLSGAFRNTGSVIASGDWQWQLSNGSMVNDGTLTASGSKQFYENGGVNLFTNNASFLKTDGGFVDLRWPMQNNGLVSTMNGTMFIANTSVQSSPASSWAVDTNGTLRMTGVTLSGRFAGNNTGLFQIEGGGVSIAANTTLSITGNGLTWSSGNIIVQGGAQLTNVGLLNIPGGHKWITGSMLNTGTILLNGDWQAQLSNGNVVNTGIMEFNGTKQCYENGGTNTFVNGGIVRLTAGVGIDFRWPTTNNGLINVQAGTFQLWGPFTQSATGTTRVASNLNVGAGQTFAAGVLEGSGSILGPVTSGATVRPGGYGFPGQLAMNSTYTQNSFGTLDIEIGGPTPGTQHDRLAITGNATLAGRIAVRFIGGFQPTAGSTYTVLTCNARTGVFPTIVLLDPLDGLEVAVDYTSTSVIVRVVQCTPCTPCDGDVNCDFALDGFDVETQEKAVGGDTTDYCQPDPDFNNDFSLDGFDVEAVEIVVGGGFCP